MDRADQKDCPAYACACSRIPTAPPCAATAARRPGPTRGQRLLGAATVVAALLVGFNALVQAMSVLAAWWLRLG